MSSWIKAPSLIGIPICVGLQVAADAASEGLQLDKVRHHSDDRAALRVGDCVEYLVDFVRIVYGYRDGMRGLWRGDNSF